MVIFNSYVTNYQRVCTIIYSSPWNSRNSNSRHHHMAMISDSKLERRPGSTRYWPSQGGFLLPHCVAWKQVNAPKTVPKVKRRKSKETWGYIMIYPASFRDFCAKNDVENTKTLDHPVKIVDDKHSKPSRSSSRTARVDSYQILSVHIWHSNPPKSRVWEKSTRIWSRWYWNILNMSFKCTVALSAIQ